MFCPGCGIEEIHSNQFCRACGTDLRPVRSAISSPDNITASAATAREEIGRAVAAKIRDTSLSELQEVAEDLLPEIEKFLESPEEKRLRRIRTGTIISSIGLGAALAFALAALGMKDDGVLVIAALGVVCFFIGMSFVINGVLATVPKKSLSDRSEEGGQQRELDAIQMPALSAQTNDLTPPARAFTSVTENTTKHLGDKVPSKGE